MRKAISKGTRFRVFTRDRFACRYCGARAENAILVVDHLIPVAGGGTDDDDNLITACEPCNQGKAARHVPPLDFVQFDPEQAEKDREAQYAAAEWALELVEMQREFRQTVCNLWCEIRERDDVDRSTLNVMVAYAREVGLATLALWIEKAHARFPGGGDALVGRYVSGIRRAVREGGQ